MGFISSGKYIKLIQIIRVLKMTEWTVILGLDYFYGMVVDWEMSTKKSYNIIVIKKWAKFPLQMDGWIDLWNSLIPNWETTENNTKKQTVQ